MTLQEPKIVVYTAFTGDFDELRPVPPDWASEGTFIAYLENHHEACGWEVRQLLRCERDPCRAAKVLKLFPHLYFPDATFSMWIDGCIEIVSKGSLRRLVAEALRDHDLAVFRHRKRDCIYAEAEACIASGKDAEAVIRRQIAKYRDEGYPERNGLAECTILVRRHGARMREFSERWHREIQLHSRRDQLSFNYVCRAMDLRYHELPGMVSKNDHFRRWPHRVVASMIPELPACS